MKSLHLAFRKLNLGVFLFSIGLIIDFICMIIGRYRELGIGSNIDFSKLFECLEEANA